jgi:hypothetical protein
MHQDVTAGQILLAEYQCIKDEQKARIGFRDNLLYVTLAAVAAVVAAAAQFQHSRLLLTLPPVSLILGWTYLVNDEKISAIGRYVRIELAPRLTALTTLEDGAVFGWEGAHANDLRRKSRKTIQCLVDVTAFCVVPFTALVVFWATDHADLSLWVVSALETLAIAGLAVQIVIYARHNRTT